MGRTAGVSLLVLGLLTVLRGSVSLCPVAMSKPFDNGLGGAPCVFDFFSSTLLAVEGGLFVASCARSEDVSIFHFNGSCADGGFKVQAIVRGSQFPMGVALGGPALPNTCIFLSATNLTLPNADSYQEIYLAQLDAGGSGQTSMRTLMSEQTATPWGHFAQLGKPHYLYRHEGVVFPGKVANQNGLYAAWRDPADGALVVRALVNASTPVPGGGGSTFLHVDYPSLDDDSLVFFGSTAAPPRPGLYHADVAQLARGAKADVTPLADWRTRLPAPYHSETFATFAEPEMHGPLVVFLGQGSGGTKGVFKVRSDTGELSIVATTGGLIFDMRMPPAVFETTVAFHATRSDMKSAIFVQNDDQCGGQLREVVREGQTIQDRKILYILFYKYELNSHGLVFYAVLDDGSFGLFWADVDGKCGDSFDVVETNKEGARTEQVA
mmetsp:Transcript_22655/g.43286  ORF Transcript_22655/g.43286 Transcript_22655/m.43286 type:complete len:437 (+) Transcript_22655:175-1485(+)|eukprot:CAMPEP_0114236414 /NCGR_PEP_ID=MMETSP0058-20121206/6829_1 /TAXON_ID=36894 /ORGANISM="Pyramimonas parkeae, CCMP726" /LENGTH=436 /DNA_ID=CAMNT_0001348357 /DNA_START=175 /DNA_END=1485 /DNA_ORIENTATION=-